MGRGREAEETLTKVASCPSGIAWPVSAVN